MVKATVENVSPDAAELPDVRERDRKDTQEHVMPPSGFRTLIVLDQSYLERDGRRFEASAGMLVSAEIHLGERTVMEYLLSPVSKTVDAGLDATLATIWRSDSIVVDSPTIARRV